ncbi:DNA-3-methyladenine glycosylase I [Salmonella enterica subsp. enterica serovar Choleraesuis]|nr:DNA-3-methyladenine glycosylase I [Salmonella enterica subsp. enterica serovar Choleraesuis]
MQRCGWVTADPLYIDYHDKEWGIPTTGERELFEMLCLEGQQAGLSWITVLKKRERYRHCFLNFDYDALANFGQQEVDQLVQDAGIIRHRGKIEAIISNARALLMMHERGETLSELVWSQVNNKPQINNPVELSDVPAVTPTAERLSKELKKRGFKFVGPTICYAFMQACGLVNDHLTRCICHPDRRAD